MIDIDNFTMSTWKITMTLNVKSEIISYIDLSLDSFIQVREQRNIFGHMMSAPRIDYSLMLSGMSKKRLRSSNLEDKIVSRSTENRHVSFKFLNLRF